MTKPEKEALAILRKIGKIRAFPDVFSRVCDIASGYEDFAPWSEKRLVWSALEELLALDLDPKRKAGRT